MIIVEGVRHGLGVFLPDMAGIPGISRHRLLNPTQKDHRYGWEEDQSFRIAVLFIIDESKWRWGIENINFITP